MNGAQAVQTGRSRGRDSGNHVCRLLARAYRDDGAVLVGKSRDGTIGSGPEQDDVAARQLEETMDVRSVFRALRAVPRHAPVQAELTAPPDGAHGPYIGHRYALPRCCPPSSVMNSRRLVIRSPRRRLPARSTARLGREP